MPITIRIPSGGGIGAVEHHSESVEAYFAHTAGLKVVACSNPSDAYWMIQEADRRRRPGDLLRAQAAATTRRRPRSPTRRPRCTRRGSCAPGRHVTIAGYGPTVPTAARGGPGAADEGLELEVIDLRSVSPLDMPTVLASVQRTGRLIVVHEAPQSFGVGAEIAARVTEAAFYSLEAPVLRVTGYDTPYPPSRLEARVAAQPRPRPGRRRPILEY